MTDTLNDASYIADFRHFDGPWQQYDFLLAARGYDWNYMVDSAEYLNNAELDNISTVTSSPMPQTKETELIDEFHTAGNSLKKMTSLATEQSSLAIGGISKTLGGLPVKIVWFNQTRVLRIFTIISDDDLLMRYAETVIRRTFGTSDAMKKAVANTSQQ